MKTVAGVIGCMMWLAGMFLLFAFPVIVFFAVVVFVWRLI